MKETFHLKVTVKPPAKVGDEPFGGILWKQKMHFFIDVISIRSISLVNVSSCLSALIIHIVPVALNSLISVVCLRSADSLLPSLPNVSSLRSRRINPPPRLPPPPHPPLPTQDALLSCGNIPSPPLYGSKVLKSIQASQDTKKGAGDSLIGAEKSAWTPPPPPLWPAPPPTCCFITVTSLIVSSSGGSDTWRSTIPPTWRRKPSCAVSRLAWLCLSVHSLPF